MSIDAAKAIGDAVLYEGYVLYPYRASAQKNRARWQFGVLMPPSYAAADGSETTSMQAECLLEATPEVTIELRLRFLQVQARAVEAGTDNGAEFRPADVLDCDDGDVAAWDEAVEHELTVRVPLAHVLEREHVVPLHVAPSTQVEMMHAPDGRIGGRVVRTCEPVLGAMRLHALLLDGPSPLYRLRVHVENSSPWSARAASREDAARRAFVAAHLVLNAAGGHFLSLLEPPEWAAPLAAACDNQHVWPVLIGAGGTSETVLASPIILYDNPRIAPESAGDLFDATEIDEILTLRTLTLTDDEKREARATDPRAAAVIDRAEAMPQEMLDRMHGAIRYLRDVTGGASPPADAPWWDPGADASVSPDTESIAVDGVDIAKGSRVRLRPSGRADAHDMFLVDRAATVEGVFRDVEENRYVAVTLDDDPGAELHQWHGRYFYFRPDEIAPLEATV